MKQNNWTIKTMNMKKTFILITLFLVAFCCPVQAQHLKFMDIPVTGTITQFQSKIEAKGVKYDKTTSNLFPAGTRAFKGTFAGEKAEIYVYYDPSTKIVYRAKAVVTCETASICENKYQEFKSLLSSKYNCFEQIGDLEGHESNTYVIAKDNPTSMDDLIGAIQIYVSKPDFIYLDERYLHIDYTDYPNSQKADDSKMKDL